MLVWSKEARRSTKNWGKYWYSYPGEVYSKETGSLVTFLSLTELYEIKKFRKSEHIDRYIETLLNKENRYGT